LVATAITVQPRFAGVLTLELVNEAESAIKLYPGVKIAQLAVHRLDGPLTFEKEQSYKWPVGPQAARLSSDRAELRQIARLGKRLSSLEIP